jgi:predicted regulator of Ras-like GTPase activity (Roadblock/LC7/MglB family)
MKQPPEEGPLHLRVGMSLFPSQSKAIDQVMSQLADRCPAQFILLADTSGLLITMQGERLAINPVGLAALIAADMSASQEIARVTGQYQSYQLTMREGEKNNTFIVESGPYLVLFVQLSREVPLGWARLLIIEAAQQLAEILRKTPDQLDYSSFGLSDEKLANAIDKSLDSLWS